MSPKSNRRSQQLVWWLTGLGVATSAAVLCIVATALHLAMEAKHSHNELASELAAIDRALQDGSAGASADFLALFHKHDPFLSRPAWAAKQPLPESAAVDRFDAATQQAVRRAEREVARLHAVYERCREWTRDDYDASVAETDAHRQSETAMLRLSEAIERANGRANLTLILQAKRPMEGSSDANEPLSANWSSLLRSIARHRSMQAELADVKFASNLMNGVLHQPRLDDLKDNRLAPALHRLKQELSQGVDDADLAALALMNDVERTLLGREFSWDERRQTVPFGSDCLVAQRQRRVDLQVRNQELQVEATAALDEAEEAVRAMRQAGVRQNQILAARIEALFRSAWKCVLVAGAAGLLIFLVLCWTIPRVIRSQAEEAARTIASLDGARRDLQAEIQVRADAEEQLRRSRTFLDTIVQNIPLAVFAKDAVNRFEFVLWNKAAEEVFGVPRDHVIDKTVYDLWSSEQAVRQQLGDEQALREGRVIDIPEEESEHPTRGRITLRTRKLPLYDAEGCASHLLCICEDVTQRKAAERSLQRALADTAHARGLVERQAAALKEQNEELHAAQRRAEEASRAKSEFLANMSHEIRTPMTAILGFSEVLLAATPTPEQFDALQTIRRNGEHLLQIINDILDLSKIEAGRMEVESIPCSPIDLLRETAELIEARIRAKRLKFELRFESHFPVTICTDPTRLRQILLNLLGNAAKFTAEGCVRLSARMLSDGDRPSRLHIEVADTGIGMSPEQMASLFRPFTQADASTTRRFGGTGLGLTISKRLIGMLGGEIEAESRPEQGSIFRLNLSVGPLDDVVWIDPNRDPLTPTRASPPADIDEPLNARVLLAEDGLDNRRLISFLLGKAGAEIQMVENGRLAVDAALAAQDKGTPFDCILMDMQMPVLDGYGAATELRQHGIRSPIVALTAHAMSGDRQRCLDAGCDDYATKPIDRARLFEVIRRQMAHFAAARSESSVAAS